MPSLEEQSNWNRPPKLTAVQYADETQIYNKHELTTLECWKYNDSSIKTQVNVKEAKENEMTEAALDGWLHRFPPEIEGHTPSAGLKILHFVQPYQDEIPFRKETFEDIRRTFGLPPVELHWASDLSGSCGMYVTEEQEYGM